MIRNGKFMSFVTKAIYDLPVPCNLSVWWNFGSLLGVCMIIQLFTGIFISMHYVAHPDMAFLSIDHLMRNVKNGWVFRYMHANGASMFFFALYVHVGRGLYYGSYKNVYVWNSGVLLFFLTMIVAFLGYVLPWGQMSYWGATVITNFFTVFPKIGVNVAMWLWGGYVVGGPTLTRFYTFHFLIPFVMLMLIVVHILFLHVTGSNNPLGIKVNSEKVPFHTYYTIKDLVGVFMFLFIFAVIVFFYPTVFMDPNNYLVSDSMDTPMHIKPEWYFLFAYTILRAIPNKTGGIVMLVLSVLILFTVPIFNKSKFVSMSFYPVSQVLFWCFFTTFVMLSWVGTKGTDYPFDFLSKLYTFNYFFYFFFVPICNFMWDCVLLGSVISPVKSGEWK